jgi:hypothetical protein
MKHTNKAVAKLWCGNEVLKTEIELRRNPLCPCQNTAVYPFSKLYISLNILFRVLPALKKKNLK